MNPKIRRSRQKTKLSQTKYSADNSRETQNKSRNSPSSKTKSRILDELTNRKRTKNMSQKNHRPDQKVTPA